MNTFAEIKSVIKELDAQILTRPVETITEEQYFAARAMKLDLQARIKNIMTIIDNDFSGTWPEHKELRDSVRKIGLKFNRYVDIQMRYESEKDPIAKGAYIYNCSPKTMHAQCMAQLEILINGKKEVE